MFVSNRKIRVLIAGIGTDNNESGRTNELAGFLRDAGMDIIGTERCETPESIAAAAIRGDVDVVGLSMNGAHIPICERVVALLRANRMDDCLVVACDADDKDQTLGKQGVSKAFRVGTSPSSVVEYLQSHVRPPWTIPENPQMEVVYV
jgi:methylmalonyl-CoA mutase C-terminal domain/subunit